MGRFRYSILLFLVFSLLILGCFHKNEKTYYSNGKLQWDRPKDAEGRLNGLIREYDSTGYLLFETQVDHDTLSGLVRTFRPSGKIQGIVKYKRGIFHEPYSEKFLTFKVYNYTNTESYYYSSDEMLEWYMSNINCHKDTCHGMRVKYSNDSIVEIWGNPDVSLRLNPYNNQLGDGLLSVSGIPKCKTRFYILDSLGDIRFKGTGKDSIVIKLDTNQTAKLKVEYVDSTYGIVHSIVTPIKKARLKNTVSWFIETYQVWDNGRYVKKPSKN